MSNKKKFLLVGGLLLIVAMLLSNQLIASLVNTEKPIEEEVVNDMHFGLVFFSINDFAQTDTLYDSLRLSGTIYNISYATDEQATRSVLFCSDERTYRIPAVEIARNAHIYYENIELTRKTYSGFSVDFSPIALKDGTYSILVQVEEDGIPVARVDSGYVLEKIKGHSVLVYRPSNLVDALPDKKDDGATSGLGEVKLNEDGTLSLSGWGICEGIDSDETEVYLEVFNGTEFVGTFDTNKECILYIAEYYESDLYYSAGFKAAIPNIKSEEDIMIYLYVKHGEDVYQCPYYFLASSDTENGDLVLQQLLF